MKLKPLRNRALAVFGVVCSVQVAAAESRYFATADNRLMVEALNAGARWLDGQPQFRARYPRERFFVYAVGSAMSSDDSRTGYCNAKFSVHEYAVLPSGLIAIALRSTVEGQVARNLRFDPNMISEVDMVSFCARSALNNLTESGRAP